jgi:glycosyltransferase involved in cell wall biosynthesis
MTSRSKNTVKGTDPKKPDRPVPVHKVADLGVVHMIGHLRLGAGRYIVDTAVEQARHFDQQVRVLVSPDAGGNWKTDPALVAELKSTGISVETAGDFFHRDLKVLLQTSYGLRDRWASDAGRFVVHAHSAMAAAAAHWAGAPVVVATCHGFDLQRPSEYDLQDALAYRLCNVVTTPSKYWAAKLTSEMAVADPPATPVGLNLGRYPRLKRTGGNHNRPLRIVTVCELTKRKGVDLLIGAMPEIWNHFPDIELHIIGDGDAAPELREQALALGNGSSKVNFHGFVVNPYLQLVDYDLFSLASRSDNLPVGIIEAMLARLPIVATEVGGIPEMVLEGHCGRLARPDCARALAEALVTMIKNGRGGMDRMGAAGESFARIHFSIEKTVAHLQGVYHDACKTGRSRVPLQALQENEHLIETRKRHTRS